MTEAYFAYGSNLCEDQMAARTGERPPRPVAAFLPGWRVVFDMVDGGEAFANIAEPGPGVWGVVYACSAEALRRLDLFEAGYERRPVTVFAYGRPLDAFAYVAMPDFTAEGVAATDGYVERVLRGAREQGFDAEYVRRLAEAAGERGREPP